MSTISQQRLCNLNNSLFCSLFVIHLRVWSESAYSWEVYAMICLRIWPERGAQWPCWIESAMHGADCAVTAYVHVCGGQRLVSDVRLACSPPNY